MSNIIPFESSNLPAYLTNSTGAPDELSSFAGGGFPIMSIKGKVFTLSRDGDHKVLPNPKDPDSPATSIDVVVVKANAGRSKVFYAGGYSEGGERKKPDCFSNTGDRPDASVERPQSNNCATCKHNQWGSKIGDNGGKGKACQDSVRIAIAAPNQINDPMLLRVPPASIKALGELGSMCAKRGTKSYKVITKIGFDLQSPTPKLMFKPIGFLDEASVVAVEQIRESDVVANILGGGGHAHEATPAIAAPSSFTAEEPEPAPAPAPKPVAKKAEPKPEPKKAVEVSDIDLGGLDLDSLNFDD